MSWKTTLCGILALLGSIVPQFFPEYARYGGFLAALATGLGLMFARDNNKTSEQVGAGTPDTRQGRLFLFLLLGFIGVAACGCTSTNITELTKALANDPATVSVKVGSVYGTVSFVRVGFRTNDTTTVSPDGTVSIKSQ